MYVPVYVVNVNDVKLYRVEQELMARIVREMHERQCGSSVVQAQQNPSLRLQDYASETSSRSSDAETTDDPVIGLCYAKQLLLLLKCE